MWWTALCVVFVMREMPTCIFSSQQMYFAMVRFQSQAYESCHRFRTRQTNNTHTKDDEKTGFN